MAKTTFDIHLTGEEINRELAKEALRLERRAEKAEEQFDELAVIHNRVEQERDDLRRELAQKTSQHEVAFRTSVRRKVKINVLEADLAEAREVLWALRPVLQYLERYQYALGWFTQGQWRDAKRKHSWLEEWLNDD